MYNIRMNLQFKKAFESFETKRKKNKVKPTQHRLPGGLYMRELPRYQYPIHRNNPRVAFEVQHQPARLHPRPVTAYRRAYSAYAAYAQHPHNKIQTVDDLCIREGYRRPNTFAYHTVAAPVLLKRANTQKVNTQQELRSPVLLRRASLQSPRTASQSQRATTQIPRVLKTKPATRKSSKGRLYNEN